MFAKFAIRHQFNILMEISLPTAYSFSEKISADTVFLAKNHHNDDVFILLHKKSNHTMNALYDLTLIDQFINLPYHQNTNYVEQLKVLRNEFLPYAEKYQLEPIN